MIDWIVDLFEKGISLVIKLAMYFWEGLLSTSLNLVESVMPKLISLGILVVLAIVVNDLLFDD